MKIGFISDVHGNLQALRTVLGELYAQQVEVILCAGDLVSYGAHPNAVIELLRSCGIPSVIGNYDAAVGWNLSGAAYAPASPATEQLREAALHWTKQSVHSKHKAYLKTLPWSMQYQIDDLRIHVLHAGLDSLDEWLTPEQPDDLAHLARRLKADVVVFGHTHQAFAHECELQLGSKTLFINPGAVGWSLDGDTRAAYAIFETETRAVQLKRVTYDLEIAVQAIMKSGMPIEIGLLVQHGLRRIEQIPHFAPARVKTAST